MKEEGIIELDNYNFIITLLSYVIELNEEDLNYVRSLTLQDYANLSRREYFDIIQNVLREFNYTIFNEWITSEIIDKEVDFYDKIVLTLLHRAMEQHTNFEEVLCGLFWNRDLLGVREVLKYKGSIHHFTAYEKLIITIIDVYEATSRFGVVPKIKEISSSSLKNMINNGHFKDALDIIIKGKEPISNTSSLNNYFIVASLKILLDRLAEIENTAIQNGETVFQLSVESLCTLIEVINSIESGDLEIGVSTLKKYLTEIDKEKYIKFILEELKRSIMLKDPTFYTSTKAIAIIEETDPHIDELTESVESVADVDEPYVYNPSGTKSLKEGKKQ